MNSRPFTYFIIFQLSCILSIAQDGPGGIGNTTGNSTLQLWLSASDLGGSLNDGDPISQWDDKSGAGNHVYASSNFPIYRNAILGSFSGVEFQGSQFLQTNGTSSSFHNPESTIFFVQYGQATGASIAMSSGGWSNEMLLFNNDQVHHSASGNFEELSHQCLEDIPQNEMTIICGVYGQTPTDLRYLVNGLESTESLFSPGNAYDYAAIDRMVTIGQRDQMVPSEFFDGTIVEVIVYNTKLPDSAILAVEEYLRCAYNVAPSICTELSNEACITSSEASLLDQVEIILAPNPARDYISFDIVGAINISQAEYFVYDQLGCQLLAGKPLSGKNDINISHFTAGIYFLRLQIKHEIRTRRFVIK